MFALYSPLAPFWSRSYWTVVAKPRTPTAATIRVPPPMSDSSRPVMSWRWVGKVLVEHGPVQSVPPLYETKTPFFVPAMTFWLEFGSTRTLPTASYCGNWPAGSV